ncbi:hypothetical protein PMIN01_11446 [Paraphaeosphaeria minitans]|uniref:Metalloendopeptidase n=1 Tax=Paraphaeosphaeria minitans TaxID=565426 RepID=A0A9P6G7L6_9PLEO|nr:hypothetical protein PMIN01_11446 [Paraphaeosphaeria minitans]
MIPYCYVDKRSYDRIGAPCRMREATLLWADALGRGPSKQTGHSLMFYESRREDDYCCTRYHYGSENQPIAPGDFSCDWDDKRWPEGTLAIHWVDEAKSGESAEGRLGYMSYANNHQKDRHFVGLPDKSTVADIAHELGHVLGMVHEHQRWDRDDHVEFRCRNLRGMREAVAEFRQTGLEYDQAWRILCTDFGAALHYTAPSRSYVKGDGLDAGMQPPLDGPGGFDMDSIMLYASKYASNAGEDKVDIPGSEFMIPERDKPSPLDAAFVSRFYPWDEAKYQEYRKQNQGAKP